MLNHLPSGRFAANGAWLAVQTMAHNLARWTARIGLGERIATTKTLRRRFLPLQARPTATDSIAEVIDEPMPLSIALSLPDSATMSSRGSICGVARWRG